MTIRTRFAPSPTGYLHIGGVRTALFNWILARQSGGQFVLRIDDTDERRNVREALQPILDGFSWLGIDWDEGPTREGTDSMGPHSPYFQSQRADRYRAAVDQLLASGHAYRDYSGSDYAAQREAAEREKRPFVYDRQWMADSEERAAQFEAEGRTAVVRLKMPREGQCEFQDEVRGDLSFEWSLESDHVIQRADGSCLYHLASVVDDHDFQITHVVRAVEHLSNTPRQIFIAQSLGYELPRYAHLPYVAEPGSKRKLSKRKIDQYLHQRDFKRLYQTGAEIASRLGFPTDPATFNPVLVDFYREIGFLPDAILNYLLLLGWSLDDKTEMISRSEMVKQFSMDRIVKSEASFDPQKLLAFQQAYMDALPVEDKVGPCLDFLQRAGVIDDSPDDQTRDQLRQILEAAGDRICMFGDVLQFDFFFTGDNQLLFEDKPFQKRLIKPDNAGFLLNELRKEINGHRESLTSVTAWQEAVERFCEDQGIGLGDIIHALRVAVTGKAAGFGMFETLEILGPERCLVRIGRALEELETRNASS